MTTPQEHSRNIQAARDIMSRNEGVPDEVMREIGYMTPADAALTTIEQANQPKPVQEVGQKVTAQTTQLELVTEKHVPRPDAPRAANLRPPRKARTAKEKAARDQGEALKHKTPPEWTLPIRAVK